MTFNRQIAALRRAAGITQFTIATASRIYQGELCLFEKGKASLNPRKLARVKSALRKEALHRKNSAEALLKAVS